MDSGNMPPPVLHILVVGFHHKLGCQVEFSHPPLVSGSGGRNECPSGWKYLPTLALPDGSHNFANDTVFFSVPSLLDPTKSVYGISCYRQIAVEKLKIRTADLTRSSVQKSVCILTRVPIYGYIEVKLSLIADAFFEQGDFSSTELLTEAYAKLNACLCDAAAESCRPSMRHFNVGLPLREIVLQWRHKTLILFKLFLLQRRVICFSSPVRDMCMLILSIASLVPRLLEKGFQEVACVRTSRPLSPMPDFRESINRQSPEVVEEHQQQESLDTLGCNANENYNTSSINHDLKDENDSELPDVLSEVDNNSTESSTEKEKPSSVNLERSGSLTKDNSTETISSTLSMLAAINPDDYRAPISIFASGNLCMPYLSLPYMDLLTDPSVLSYIIGTSNILFQQKRQLADVHIDVEGTIIEIFEADLRRQLVLTTEDLRFMDFVLRHTQFPKENGEGCERWVREQFQGYILALLSTMISGEGPSKDGYNYFNAQFMQAFKKTQCFQEWYDVKPEVDFFDNLPTGHPFCGAMTVTDMKLKIAQTMQNSESGRKLNHAVNTTSRAVGGAISQAKGALTNWWSSITTQPNPMDNGNGDNGMNVDGGSQTLPQEPTVSFQNHQNIDEIEISVNIGIVDTNEEIEENTNIVLQAIGIDGEKLLDSAEEVDEDIERRLERLENAENPLECKNSKEQQSGSGGVVEIGKEAVVLDKSVSVIAERSTSEALLPNDKNQSSGDVFIV